MNSYNSAKEFYDYVLGKSFNTDGAYGNQCWDLFDFFCRQQGIESSRYCAQTGYVGDLWRLRDTYGYSEYFDYINTISELQDGDWIFWSQHVAMYYGGLEVGQNQGYDYVTEKSLNRDGILGAMRFKAWHKTTPSIWYRAHVSNIGWQAAVANGEIAGTTGQKLQMEAIQIAPPDGLWLEVQVHVQDIGWMTYTVIPGISTPTMGSVGHNLEMEAIKIKVLKNTTGCTLRYQAHVMNKGWLAECSAGEVAGTTGEKRRMEAFKLWLE